MKIKDIDVPKSVYIYGENHTIPEEVERIRNAVVRLNPDVIIHELYWEDKEFYNDALPNVDVLPLEDEVKYNDDLRSQFEKREVSMVKHLNNVVNDCRYQTIAVVVGDTHLRTIETNDLGNVSPLIKWAKDNNAQVIRSSYKEIK